MYERIPAASIASKFALAYVYLRGSLRYNFTVNKFRAWAYTFIQ